ncbi:hypothetical protein DFP73DRAFT_214997 [Morchella snyderi]|nr:hypothetical protein DFP73DRAFT_214997 [Morchella snyderi]
MSECIQEAAGHQKHRFVRSVRGSERERERATRNRRLFKILLPFGVGLGGVWLLQSWVVRLLRYHYKFRTGGSFGFYLSTCNRLPRTNPPSSLPGSPWTYPLSEPASKTARTLITVILQSAIPIKNLQGRDRIVAAGAEPKFIVSKTDLCNTSKRRDIPWVWRNLTGSTQPYNFCNQPSGLMVLKDQNKQQRNKTLINNPWPLCQRLFIFNIDTCISTGQVLETPGEP